MARFPVLCIIKKEKCYKFFVLFVVTLHTDKKDIKWKGLQGNNSEVRDPCSAFMTRGSKM